MKNLERSKTRSELDAEKPIITLEDFAKRLGIDTKEIHDVTLDGKHYGVPSSHAVESKLLDLFARMGEKDTPEERQQFLTDVTEITTALKEAELRLAQRDQRTFGSVTEQKAYVVDAERLALGAIRHAENILRKQSLLSREDLRKIRDIRREHTDKYIAQPDELLS